MWRHHAGILTSAETDWWTTVRVVKEWSAVVGEIIRASQSLHRSGTFSTRAFEALVRHASQYEILNSAETGSGASTLLFSHLSKRHVVFALDGGTDSVRAVQTSPFLRSDVVTFVEGPTQITLPSHRFEEKLQLTLIDGPHAYPFPDLEYYYFYEHLDENALLVLDDIHIRSVNNLFEFLRADDMFDLSEVVDTTAFFRRTDAPIFPRFGDGWWMQGYNRRDFEVTVAESRQSDDLISLPTPTPFYLDELGPIKNPSRRLRLLVPASEPLLVAGWAIDERSQQPPPWIELVLDGNVYRAETGVHRGDVAKAYGNFRYLRCGFRTTLSADQLSPGRHTLALRIILPGGRTYYEAPTISFRAR